jgi:shikimate dehydrogenase
MEPVSGVTLRGTTRLVGVIGCPVEHSLSPPMHNAAFAHLGMDWAYVAFRVEPDCVREALRGMVALGMVGLNVTIPHKQAAYEGVLRGYSTDGSGFVRSVEETGATLQGKAVALIGAGGSARAVAHALFSAGVSQLTLIARRPGKAAELAALLAEHTGREAAIADLNSDVARQAVLSADLIIDSTSVGMHPNVDVPPVIPPDWMHSGQLVCDLTYNPRETTLLKAARRAGAATLDGAGMLVHQGAIAFEIWTGTQAPVEVMREALLRELA